MLSSSFRSNYFSNIFKREQDLILSKNYKYNNLNIKTSSISMWFERWFLSSNAKDIGVLYLIYALFSGLVGTAFSVLIRLGGFKAWCWIYTLWYFILLI